VGHGVLDYAAGQWPRHQGFETYIRASRAPEQADDAQFYIGEAYQLDGKMREALAAYEPSADYQRRANRAADSYYKRGVINHAEPAGQGPGDVRDDDQASSRASGVEPLPGSASCWTASLAPRRRGGRRRTRSRPEGASQGTLRHPERNVVVRSFVLRTPPLAPPAPL
jgi:hypothetical protein